MDAIDVNWCLLCGLHTEGPDAYCSRECQRAHSNASVIPKLVQPTRYYPRSPPPPEDFTDDEEDDFLPDCYDIHPTQTKGIWIGRGSDGISAWAREVPSGPPPDPDLKSISHGLRPPKLICDQRLPVPPTLCMSRTTPVLPEPSQPILTPQPYVPSLYTSHTDASLTSLTTALSSISIATPATPASEAAHDDPPSAETQKAGFMNNLTAHFRFWAAGSSHPEKHKPSLRSKTITRACDASVAPPTVEPQPIPTIRAMRQRPRSPPSFFPVPNSMCSVPAEKPHAYVLGRGKEKIDQFCSQQQPSSRLTEDHPAFRLRGRRPSRVVS